MSGICCIYSPSDPSLANREILRQMLDGIGHRGKAARRSVVDDKAGVAVGHVFASAFRGPAEEEIPNWHEDEDYVATRPPVWNVRACFDLMRSNESSEPTNQAFARPLASVLGAS